MKCTVCLRTGMLLLACLGLLIPSPLVAAVASPAKAAEKSPPSTARSKVLDVELQKGGVLLGQVVDAQGAPQVKMPVSLLRGDKTLATATTNRGGFFAVREVPAGTYRLAAGKTQGAYRLWAKGTSPPGSQPGTLMVVGQGPSRGQNGGSGPIGHWLSNPWVIGALIAAAIAIPVAIHNHQIDHDEPASG